MPHSNNGLEVEVESTVMTHLSFENERIGSEHSLPISFDSDNVGVIMTQAP